MNTLEMIQFLGSNYVLRLEKWQDRTGWRVGLNWVNEKEYLYVCEKPTLEEAIKLAYDYSTHDHRD